MKLKNTRKMEAKINKLEKDNGMLKASLAVIGVGTLVNGLAALLNSKKTKQNSSDIQVLSSMTSDFCECECD